jgi:hypothetical protein
LAVRPCRPDRDDVPRGVPKRLRCIRAETVAVGACKRSTSERSSVRMQSERRWLPGWQRIELVELCLERGVTRRQAGAWRCVSVAAVQHVERALAFLPTATSPRAGCRPDNAWCYAHNRSRDRLLNQHGIQHRRIPPRSLNRVARQPGPMPRSCMLPSGAGGGQLRWDAIACDVGERLVGDSARRVSRHGRRPTVLRPALLSGSPRGGRGTWPVPGPCRSPSAPHEGRGCRRPRRARRRSRAW